MLTCDYYPAQDYVSGEVVITENTRGIHRYAASWLSGKEKRSNNFVANVRKFFGEKTFRKIMKTFLKIRVKRYTRKYKKSGKLAKMKEKTKKEA